MGVQVLLSQQAVVEQSGVTRVKCPCPTHNPSGRGCLPLFQPLEKEFTSKETHGPYTSKFLLASQLVVISSYD